MVELGEKSEAILQELKKISKILVLVNASTIENELSKIANTEARKKMWVLIDGKRMPQDIANMVGVSGRAVLYFLEDMAAAGFIEYSPREPPQRILDYVPPSWIDLITKGREGEKEAETKSQKEESHA